MMRLIPDGRKTLHVVQVVPRHFRRSVTEMQHRCRAEVWQPGRRFEYIIDLGRRPDFADSRVLHVLAHNYGTIQTHRQKDKIIDYNVQGRDLWVLLCEADPRIVWKVPWMDRNTKPACPVQILFPSFAALVQDVNKGAQPAVI